jgi:hypothetical protein
MISLTDLPNCVWFELLQSWITVKGIGRFEVALGPRRARSTLHSILSTKTFLLGETVKASQPNAAVLLQWLAHCNVQLRSIAVDGYVAPDATLAFFRKVGKTLQRFEYTCQYEKSTLISVAAACCTHLKSVTLHNIREDSEAVATMLMSAAETIESLTLIQCGQLPEKTKSIPCPALRRLHIEGSLGDKFIAEMLKNATSIAVLTLHADSLSATMGNAQSFRSLGYLSLHYVQRGNFHTPFSAAARLQVVELVRLTEVVDSSVRVLLQSAPLLYALRLSDMASLTDAILQDVANECGARLRRLDVERCNHIAQTGLRTVVLQCPQLECLRYCSASGRFPGWIFDVLQLAPQLLSVGLDRMPLPRAQYYRLATSMPSVQNLAIFLEQTPSLAELRELAKPLSNLNTLLVALNSVGQEGRLLSEAMSALLPCVKVVRSGENVNLWRGLPGMTSTSHKVRTSAAYALICFASGNVCCLYLRMYVSQLPYEWEEGKGCW